MIITSLLFQGKRDCSMKKALSFVACLVLCAAFTVQANAASGINAEEQKVLNILKAGVSVNGKTVSLDASYINTAENYMNSDGIDITAEQASVVINQVDAAKKVIIDNNITDLKTMPKKFQDQIIGYAQSAAKELGLTLVADYSSKTIVVKDASGKVLFTASKVIKNTGDDYTMTLAISGAIALLIACAGIVAAKKGLFVKE